MRLPLLYPFLVRGIPEGLRNERDIYGLDTLDFDFLELGNAEAPIVCEIGQTDPTSGFSNAFSMFRQHEGEFYVNTGPQRTPEWGNCNVLPHLFAEMARRKAWSPLKTIWPEQVHRVLSAINAIAPMKASARSSSLELLPDVFNVSAAKSARCVVHDDITVWRELALEHLAGAFLCDGHIWIKSPEPALMVTRKRGAVDIAQIDLSIFEPGREAAKPFGGHTFAPSLYWRDDLEIYPLSRLDELKAEIASLPDRTVVNQSIPLECMTVYAPELFGSAFASQEIERLAKTACSHFVQHHCTNSRRPLVKTPAAMSSAYHTLMDSLYEEGDNRIEMIESSLGTFAHACERHAPELYDTDFSETLSRNAARLSEYWNDRDMDIPALKPHVP